MKERHHELETDIVVAGGGMAGVCAAIAAARHGARVILLQDRPVLGGNASSEVRMHICGADCSGGRPEIDARESGLIEEIKIEEGVRNPQRSASMFDIVLYDLVLAEPNVTPMLNTFCDGALVSEDRIVAVTASRPSTEDAFTIYTELAIDCTGDGRLGHEAGAVYREGREGRDAFNESIAPERGDNLRLGSTLLFMAREHDRPMPFTPPSWARVFPSCDDLPHRRHAHFDYGFWWMEWGGTLDTIADNETIRDELLRIAMGVWDHIKNRADHGADNWALEWVGMVPGKRESRRFEGDHIMRESDMMNSVLFRDRVAYGGWSLDLHPPDGIDDPGKPFTPTHLPDLYSIPLRSLYSRNIDNMLMAGRNVSASHVAFGSTRVMATCAVMGQAAGTAAAMCVEADIAPRDIVADDDLLTSLQQTLVRDDAYIIDCPNNDPEDVARGARVTASSQTDGGAAKNVVNGVTRGVGEVSNRWISEPGTPQWIRLDFDNPQTVSTVHLTFDTGLHRPLGLSHNQGLIDKMVRGAQPEVIADYRLEGIRGDETVPLIEVTDNYRRKRVHRFDAIELEGLRLVATKTGGDESVRLFEMRAY